MDGDCLSICLAGDRGERPDEVRRDDESCWCVKTFERCERPPGRRPGRAKRLLDPGRLIPKAFLKGRGRS